MSKLKLGLSTDKVLNSSGNCTDRVSYAFLFKGVLFLYKKMKKELNAK